MTDKQIKLTDEQTKIKAEIINLERSQKERWDVLKKTFDMDKDFYDNINEEFMYWYTSLDDVNMIKYKYELLKAETEFEQNAEKVLSLVEEQKKFIDKIEEIASRSRGTDHIVEGSKNN